MAGAMDAPEDANLSKTGHDTGSNDENFNEEKVEITQVLFIGRVAGETIPQIPELQNVGVVVDVRGDTEAVHRRWCRDWRGYFGGAEDADQSAPRVACRGVGGSGKWRSLGYDGCWWFGCPEFRFRFRHRCGFEQVLEVCCRGYWGQRALDNERSSTHPK